MKKIILTLLLSTVIIVYSYAEKTYYKTFAISAYKSHTISNENKLFQGNSTDVICVDPKNAIVTIFSKNTKEVFRINYHTIENDRMNMYAIDKYNHKVVITFTTNKKMNCFMFVFSYQNAILTYLAKEVHIQ